MARHFNGTTDYLDAGTGVRGADLLGVLAECWVNLDDVATQHSPMSRWNNADANSQWLLAIAAGGAVVWNIMDSSLNGHGLTGGSVTAGAWHHVAGMYDGATMYVFVDGVETSQTINVTLLHPASPEHVYIGRQTDNAFFKGHIAECTLSLVNTGVNPAANYVRLIVAGSQTAATPECDGMYDTEQIDYWPLLGDSPEPTYGLGFDNATVVGTTVTPHAPVSTILSLGRARAQATGSAVA